MKLNLKIYASVFLLPGMVFSLASQENDSIRSCNNKRFKNVCVSDTLTANSLNVCDGGVISGGLTVNCDVDKLCNGCGSRTRQPVCIDCLTLTVNGTSEFNGTVDANCDLNVERNETVGGNVTVGGNETVGGDVTVGGDETVDGNLTVDGCITTPCINITGVTGCITTPCFVDTGNATIDGNLTVGGNETIGGNLDVTGSLTVDGCATMCCPGGSCLSVGPCVNVTGCMTLNGVPVTGGATGATGATGAAGADAVVTRQTVCAAAGACYTRFTTTSAPGVPTNIMNLTPATGFAVPNCVCYTQIYIVARGQGPINLRAAWVFEYGYETDGIGIVTPLGAATLLFVIGGSPTTSPTVTTLSTGVRIDIQQDNELCDWAVLAQQVVVT